ncbi:MAG: glycosyltransferase [Lachnospiraceae bacterium]|nr:glycosyltransferase [Lachnospiraceae bacterium]
MSRKSDYYKRLARYEDPVAAYLADNPGDEAGAEHIRELMARAGELPGKTVEREPEEYDDSKLSVLIPSKDHPGLLSQCLQSFVKYTDYDKLEFIVVDNGSSPENREKYEELKKSIPFTYIYEAGEFNFSRMCNSAVKASIGRLLLFLNDDIELRPLPGREDISKWLKIMAAEAIRPETGAVGALLYYPPDESGEYRIQHAGVSNIGLGPVHKHNGSLRRPSVPKEVIAVTAACLLVERKKFREAGGFCEELEVAYNDVDLCFTLYEKGYRNIVRPEAELIHHESTSRGYEESAEKRRRQLEEWVKLYKRHPEMYGRDPYLDPAIPMWKLTSDMKPEFTAESDAPGISSEVSELQVLKPSQSGRLLRKLGIDIAPLYHIDHAFSRIYMDKDGEPRRQWRIEGWAAPRKKALWNYTRYLLLRDKWGTSVRIKLFETYRPDTKAVLTEQEGYALSGFAARIDEEKVTEGKYEAGFAFDPPSDGYEYICFTGVMIEFKYGSEPVITEAENA